MREIGGSDIMHTGFLAKEPFTGSSEGMRYRLEKDAASNSEPELLCTVWPEPYSYAATDPSLREEGRFPFSEEGLEEARKWMNDRKAPYFAAFQAKERGKV